MIYLEKPDYLRPVSDLHLNLDVNKKRFNPEDLWVPPPLETDSNTALVIAGDIWESKKAFSFANFSWFKKISALFKYIIVVLGNHDYYDGQLGAEIIRFNNYLKEQGITNVFLLENSGVMLGDVKVIGATLWSDYNRGNPQSMYYAKNGYPDKENTVLNDFKYIRTGAYQKIHPKDVIGKHIQSKQFILDNAHKNDGASKVVLVTHHAPSYEAIPEEYTYKEVGDWKWHKAGAYFSDLSAFAQECVIDLWIHGHTHQARQYFVGKTPVLVNPRGYGAREEKNIGFNDKLVLSLADI